jgi:hypothetical protein
LFKFFREYNKYILVVGGSILMVAFLIEPALNMIRPGGGVPTVGTLAGERITAEHQQQAAHELMILERIPLLGQMTYSENDPLRWFLMVHEARQMGLSASRDEVEEMLRATGMDNQALGQLMQGTGATRGFIEQAVRHWLMVQTYRELLLGQSHTPVSTRAQNIMLAQQFGQQGMIGFAQSLIMAAMGSQRVSDPLIQHFLQSQAATVAGQVVLISHEGYLDRVEPPTAQELQALFEEYREMLPGRSQPYGFGYRAPARVRLQWLTVPIDAVRDAVEIDEADALEFYQQNRQQFTTRSPEGDGTPQVRPYAEVRDRVIEQLRDERADRQAMQVIRAAQTLMREDDAVRRLPVDGAYRALPADFSPMSMEQVAERVQQRHGVLPEVRQTRDWRSIRELRELPGLGRAVLVGRREVEFVPYVMSAREMEPARDNPLIPLRLQVGIPSEPLRSADGSYHVFRLTDAEPERSPASLDEVRDQVEADARRLAAFRLLLSEQPQWVQRARAEGIEPIADELDLIIRNVPQLPRQAMMGPGGVVEVPGIGPAEGLLAAMFQLGQMLYDRGELAAVPDAERIDATPLENRLSLAVFRLDAFTPMSRAEYESAIGDPSIGPALTLTMLDTEGVDDPLSNAAIHRRLNFVPRDDG